MTQIEMARAGKISPEMKYIARDEKVSPEFVRQQVARGRIVILKNKQRNDKNFKPLGIGEGLRTKVNANIGVSTRYGSLAEEKEKLAMAITAGADTVMDLSIGKNLVEVLEMVLEKSTIPVGTVPVYQAIRKALEQKKSIPALSVAEFFAAIEEQAKAGVDFITVHCGVTRRIVEILKNSNRLMGMVSRGGTFMAEWVYCNKKENPLYEHFDRLLEIARTYDLTLSLGDGMRPGSIIDASDKPQYAELAVLGELAKRAWKKNVQVMIEGPGHVPLHLIKENVILQKKICHQAPFYVLGPLVTDVAPGYDHITCAIGGALAASYGADFLCYVTPSEHLRLPDVRDVREGVIASRIAAHAADLSKNIPGVRQWDKKISQARKDLDWKRQEELAIDRDKFSRERKKTHLRMHSGCTMCGEFCAMKEMDKFL